MAHNPGNGRSVTAMTTPTLAPKRRERHPVWWLLAALLTALVLLGGWALFRPLPPAPCPTGYHPSGQVLDGSLVCAVGS